MPVWNPWHGCHKISPGCQHCYMFRRDASFGKDSTVVEKTASFSLPLAKTRDGAYRLPPGSTVYACMTSDFFFEEADAWRADVWDMIRVRRDLRFFIITKRIERFSVALPDDWGDGWNHVTVCSTCETQQTADRRVPQLLRLPICHREIIHEPMLESIHILPFLQSGKIERVTCGGESGPDARVCDFSWVLHTRDQCLEAGVPFSFKQTGAHFVKDGRHYAVPRPLQHAQAKKAGIDLR